MRRLRGPAIALAVVGLWELAARLGLLSPMIFGSPGAILRAAVTDGATFAGAFGVTLGEIAVATAIAWLGGVACGLAIGAAPEASLVLAPLLSAAIAVPLVVLYPVAVAWLGIGPTSKIVYGAAAGFFPIALATVLGIRAIDRRYGAMARAIGANRRQILLQVSLRLALPSVLAGLRIGTSLVIIGVVQSEMLASTDGLGFWISYYRSLFQVGHVYLGIALVLVVAAAANLGLATLERRYGRWRAGSDRV